MEIMVNLAKLIASSETVFAVLFILTILFVSKKAMEIYKEAATNSERREQYILDLHTKRETNLQELLANCRTDGARREMVLMNKIDETNTQQAEIATTLHNINMRMEAADYNLVEIRKEIGELQTTNKKG